MSRPSKDKTPKNASERVLRAVAWCAVSSKAQNADERASIPEQIKRAESHISKQGWQHIATLVVPGHSRDYIDIHECATAMRKEGITAFDDLIALWERNAFDVLVVRDTERFARTQSLHAYVIECTVKSGARIYSFADGWIDDTNYRLFISMGGYKTASDIDRLVKGGRIGRDKRAQRGLPPSKPIWSHKVLRDDVGKGIKLIPNEEAWLFFDTVARLLLERHGWNEIEAEMKAQGIKTSWGAPPSSANIWYWFYHPQFWGHQARDFSTNSKGGYKRLGMWSVEEGHTIPQGVTIYYNVHDPFFTGDYADQIKAEMKRRHALTGSARPRTTRRFSHLILCGVCGRALATTDKHMRCSSRYHDHLPDCDNGSIMVRDIQAYIDQLLTLLLDADEVDFSLLSGNTPIDDNVDMLTSEIAKNEKRLITLLREQADAPDATQPYYRDEIRRISDRIETLRAQVDTVKVAEARNARRAKVGALEQIRRTRDKLWALPDGEINQLLHQLFGDSRLVMRYGEIIGIATV